MRCRFVVAVFAVLVAACGTRSDVAAGDAGTGPPDPPPVASSVPPAPTTSQLPPVPTTARPVTPTASPTAPPIAAMAVADLAATAGTAASDVIVVSAEERTWPDTCLGLPAPELCVPGETPGYVITLRLRGVEHVYHTDTVETIRYAGAND